MRTILDIDKKPLNNGVKGKQVAMWIYLLGVCLFALESIGVTIVVLVFLIENEFERFFAALLILICKR